MKIDKFYKYALLSIGVSLGCLAHGVSAENVSFEYLVHSSFDTNDGQRKKTIAVLGDGFTENDLDTYKQYVEDNLLNSVFKRGPLGEDIRAFDIVRLDVISNDSGITELNADGDVIVQKDTALDYAFREEAGCYFDSVGDSDQRVNDQLTEAGLQFADYVVLVFNSTRWGGCRWGNSIAVTSRMPSVVVGHEFGHLVADLCDEYETAGESYTGDEPSCVNMTLNTDLNTLKWKEFVNPNNLILPPPGALASNEANSKTVGLFEGGLYNEFGIFRPTSNSRMRDNDPDWSPVHFKRFKEVIAPNLERSLKNSYHGDFNGDGRDDLVVHNDTTITLYTAESSGSSGSNLSFKSVLNGKVSSSELFPVIWRIDSSNKVHVGDFNGDGRDDLLVTRFVGLGTGYIGLFYSNGSEFDLIDSHFVNYNLGSQRIKESDNLMVGDFNSDGRDDFIVANATDRKLSIHLSEDDFFTPIKHYDASSTDSSNHLPGWQATDGDEFFMADFNGDNREDLYILNQTNWGSTYLLMLRSNGSQYEYTKRYNGNSLTNWPLNWAEVRNNQLIVADIDGDGSEDLYAVNRNDPNNAVFAKIRSLGNRLEVGHKTTGTVDQISLRAIDHFFAGDIDGDGGADLYGVINRSNGIPWLASWDSNSISEPSTFLSMATGNVGGFNFSSDSEFRVADFDDDSKSDLFVSSDDWFGIIRTAPSSGNFVEAAKHHKWIYNAEYHQNGIWTAIQ